jgi:ubiquinone/menaquinone biosynthesis C-methylase UbiE
MRAWLTKLKRGTEHLNYGRDVIAEMIRSWAMTPPPSPARILDVGMGSGEDLLRSRDALVPMPVELYGLDSYGPNAEAAAQKGIRAVTSNVEREAFPYEDGFFHVVIANQVLEHAKEIFWIVSEISRVLAPGGLFVAGVPNLASLHSRIMLLLGMQPSPIEVLGPHVRGFTRGGFERFVCAGGYFEVTAVRGSNFYPFPAAVSRPLARAFPSMAVSLFFACLRTGKPGRFEEVLGSQFFETDYFRGPAGS